jgi:hypothetical protein
LASFVDFKYARKPKFVFTIPYFKTKKKALSREKRYSYKAVILEKDNIKE